MPKVGTLGHQMMFRSCTVQTNLDFSSEADMVKKFRVSLALQPVATALFANSPFGDGGLNGFQSYRSHVWTDTDNNRTGMLPFVFEDGMSFQRYADYALDVPMYFVKRNGEYLDATGQSFRDFLDGRLPTLPGEKPVMSDWEDHLSTLFPEVRLKTFLEMRGADSGAWDSLCALPAFWVGLLYDDTALDAAWDLVKDWSADEREGLRLAAGRHGLRAGWREHSMTELAREVLAISREGLNQRRKLNGYGENEGHFLDELDEIVASERTRADALIARFNGEWGGSIEPVFTEAAY